MFAIFIVILILSSNCLCDEQPPHVTTPLGQVQGSVLTSESGRNYAVFEGIPYAKPPVGDLRFEEPQPPEPWSGTWIANFTTACAQSIFMPGFGTQTDEDCLHANVYVPLDKLSSQEKLDVIVYIHGGAFMYGSGHTGANPRYLMDLDLVSVTFNYRLGILGFLSTQDEVVPGNNGFKDQVLVLKWVQLNIASFGGNPDSVTLIGLSAGGSSVHLHYFSELSKGLFHRGISNSGVALNSFSLQEKPLKKAKMLAKGVGCPTISNKEMVECLKQRPHQHLLAQVHLFFGYGFLPFAPFAAVVEKNSKKPFLSENPYRLLVQGQVYDVPWIASNTAHEGLVMFLFINNDTETIDREWENVAPYLLDFQYTVPQTQWKDVARKIKDFYLGENQDINKEDNYLKTIKLFGDRLFLVDAEDAVRLQAKVTKSPVYYYYFNYPGDVENGLIGHGDDAKYFFGDNYGRKPLKSNEIKMKDVMMKMLISFAKSGTPKLTGIDWKPTGYEKFTYLNISGYDNIKLEETPELTPRNFWKSLGIQENQNALYSKVEL